VFLPFQSTLLRRLIYNVFKQLADKKHEIFDEDLQALITEVNTDSEEEHYKLIALKVCSETGETPNYASAFFQAHGHFTLGIGTISDTINRIKF
jgi:hypothetical protein